MSNLGVGSIVTCPYPKTKIHGFLRCGFLLLLIGLVGRLVLQTFSWWKRRVIETPLSLVLLHGIVTSPFDFVPRAADQNCEEEGPKNCLLNNWIHKCVGRCLHRVPKIFFVNIIMVYGRRNRQIPTFLSRQYYLEFVKFP